MVKSIRTLFVVALATGIVREASAIVSYTKGMRGKTGPSNNRRESRRRRRRKRAAEHRLFPAGVIECTGENEKEVCGPYGMYCRFSEDAYRNMNSCSHTATGHCHGPSPACPRIYRPVCACDGETTYSNSCLALFGQAIESRQAGYLHLGPCGQF